MVNVIFLEHHQLTREKAPPKLLFVGTCIRLARLVSKIIPVFFLAKENF